MSRRRVPAKRDILPDPKFGDKVLAKLINVIMTDGIVYGALDRLGEKAGGDPIDKVRQALTNIGPLVEVKSRRVGGANYQVPTEVRPARQQALAMRWLIDAARKRGEKSMALRLAGEIGDAAENRGAAVKKREDTHRMAEANKAFSHYRW
jgi:small subunit ribosomal protein S7